MKLISWNVNGLRAVLKKGLIDFIESEQPDVLCLQEIKSLPESVDSRVWPQNYHVFWNPAIKAGYSGTLMLVRDNSHSVTAGIGNKTGDAEGRVQTLDLGEFYLVNVYTPNSRHELVRLGYRIRSWEVSFRKHLARLTKIKPVVVCGDFNVAHEEIDLANPASNRRNPGFSDEERRAFGKLLKTGFIDTFRHLHPDQPNHYTWWSYRTNARARNVGWRLDYFLISKILLPLMETAIIYKDVEGSDHCPVGLKLKAG